MLLAPGEEKGKVADSHEAYDSRHFDDGEDELGFTIAFDATQIDGYNDGEEDSNEHSLVDAGVPVGYGDGRRYNFQWQYY